MFAEPEMTVVEYQAAAHLGLHTAVVAVAEMMMSVVLHSGTQSAAGSLAIRVHESHFEYGESFTSLTVCPGRAILGGLSSPCLGANCILYCLSSGLRLAKLPSNLPT